MAAISSKYHVKIGEIGFLLARQPRVERHIYNRKEAPSFVNKFSSGEPNYRDSTFFPHWVQLNWLNGFNQEFFDDGGKFFRSSGIDITESLQITLQKAFTSIGQTLAAMKVTTQNIWRTGAAGTPVNINPGAGGSGRVYTNTKDTWALAHDAASADGNDTAIYAGAEYLSSKYYVNRTLLPFDTSTLPAGCTITAAKIVLYRKDSVEHFANADTTAACIVAATITDPTTRTNADFNDFGTTIYATVNLSATTNNTNVEFTLDAAGIATINKTGWSKFGLRLKRDIDNSAPTGGNLICFDVVGGTNQPYIEVTYTVPGTNYEFTHIVGCSDGKIYSGNGSSTFTELFDTRRLEWFETGTDANKIIGDVGGVETAQGQSFQLDAASQVKAVQVYIKKNAGTPGTITCRIETNSTDKPSGTLVNDAATATIPAFTTATYGWITVTFTTAFALSATTVYWIVLKTAAADNDINYAWAADSSSPGYTPGTMAASTDGGSTWAAVTGSDAYFRVLSNATSVNCSHNTSLGGTEKLFFGVGDQSQIVNGDARIYSYDGTTWVLVKMFATTNESSVNCILEYGTTTVKAYIGLGHVAKVYSTTDWSTFTLEKTITVPDNPGWVFTMCEYNKKLYVGGGYPSSLPGTSYQFGGFLYSYDEYSWENIGHFQHTVVTSLEVYDNLMFIGTIKKRLYVYNTASIDKLFEWPWNLKISAMKKWDDKLVIATCSTPGNAVTGGEGIYLFDRNGFHNAFAVTDKSWYSLLVFNNDLIGGNDDGYCYRTSFTSYQTTGYLQTSYDEAQLPSIYKVRKSVVLLHAPLPAGCTIALSYKTDESDASWTALTSTDSIENSKISTFDFPSGVYNYKISFKITFTTTVTTSTPKVKKIIMKYVLSPDFKYLWEMKLLCVDKIVWLDGTEPVAIVGTAIAAGDASITLNSTDKAVPTEGFPDPSGSTMYASVINPDTGAVDLFTYTGKTDTTLTGIPTTGGYALGVHAVGHIVRVRGADLHLAILAMKQTRTFYTFTDIDGLTYTVLFHSYQADNWVINQDDYYGGLENEVPITLLEV